MTRFGYVMTTYFALLGFCGAAIFPVSPKFIWNASASVPIGLYVIHPAGALHVTELVVVRPPAPLASFLDQRRYLAKGVPMLKRILALPGQTVCRTDRAITVDGVAMGEALEHDSRGRPLPVWQGCRVVAGDDVFLMNWQSEDSFDGRYFGPLPASTIVGRADPLWTRQED
ncbi:conjugative transfer signal peptidase TraF [Sphingomonas sp.]|uniref:conjugative transfer signal peptidase TraF n=1 Tax=Sphingomonas sp. TaxID=28214 RepID=UPI0025FF25AE|nr:conjugative transfer signal peptidase TraF [Sphingomonas sp.]MBV9528083.1 conjugative transfer signal peptidase TraF [Sphingomonas sp.]